MFYALALLITREGSVSRSQASPASPQYTKGRQPSFSTLPSSRGDDNPSRLSESTIRVGNPSPLSESAIRVHYSS